ncbi:DEAD/DEAH box helicase family protein [Roseomonas sp. HF4]|uniref:DEAD/DEAH box helicase family protein n=1 Tax=Roseomonas sp. HF4 TaxID=2562313 RepID=UPI0010C05288|nr:DEAD/DEAH box helicase family protein [Roseomonas sp. HF4]
MPYNEAETRYELIDPVLRDKGYRQWRVKLETPAPVEPTGNKGRRRAGNGRTDYLLCVQVGEMPKPLPVGVIEAKAETEDPLKGMQQGKRYAECLRFAVQYVFATNGHRYGEFDKGTQMPAGPHPFPDFPSHDDLTARYAKDIQIDIAAPEAAMLFMADAPAYNKPRYYQDAAIRAAFEKVLQCQQSSTPPRALLSLATGAGKTVIAANLLWRLHEAGQLAKPALFLCDRDELREQAWEKISKAFPKGSVRIVRTERGQNAAKNAKVHIATYHTLGLDDEDQSYASFLTEHYAENAFSVIIIDECHRSAWGRWSEVLKRNPEAIQIGLTATPRQLRDSKHQTPDDAGITANNLNYFGEPVYEYTLIQAQEDGYLAACEIVRLKPSIDWKTFTRDDVLAAKPIDARTGRPISEEDLKAQYAANTFDNDILLPERIATMCADLFQRLCEHGGPEQKVIIFCNRDLHADRVAMQMQRLYAVWCQEQGVTPKDHYAFKCTAEGGSELIEQMRGSGERCFIACTVDLLATGVDIERLNAVVFFRYLQSSITFYQMVGRGTRIHEETQKYKFWLYDYTGVTDLFGTDFITAPTQPRLPTPDDDDGGGDDGGGDDGGRDPLPLPEMKTGHNGTVVVQGRFILQERMVNGVRREVPVPLDEYRQDMVARVLREAATIHDFRGLWVETQRRRKLIEHLLGERFSPDTVRELMGLGECDHFDLFAHYGYREKALKRSEREGAYLERQASWFASADPKAAIVLRGLGHQFGLGGTDALESAELWNVPEIRRAGGLHALRSLGIPSAVVIEAKTRLFGA